MQRYYRGWMISLLLALLATPAQAHPKAPDLPPDASTAQYRAALGGRLLLSGNDGLDALVQLGERNLAWLEHINSFRPSGDKLSLTSKATQSGIPIDKPSEYNPTLIQAKLTALKPKIPASMLPVLFQNQPFTDQPPVALDDYLTASRELDRVYQSGLRWRMMSSYLPYLSERRHEDVRGWYFLSRDPERAAKLRDLAHQPADFQKSAQSWLTGLCFNNDETGDITLCQKEVASQISQNKDLEAYYDAKAPAAKAIFDSYFAIPDGVARPEIRFEAGEAPKLIVPFTDPGTPEVRSFLQDNIQDEWRYQAWHLELPFATTEGLAHVEFVPGVVPHVNALGGDTITMNSTQPLTEYDAQWTIRHEFGHVLGFPDCYVEFYESERNVIVNYQFDIDNLMCSRRGHIQERHVAELQRTYTK